MSFGEQAESDEQESEVRRHGLVAKQGKDLQDSNPEQPPKILFHPGVIHPDQQGAVIASHLSTFKMHKHFFWRGGLHIHHNS